MPGPTANPATNFIMTDIAVRAGGYLARRSLEKAMLARRYGTPTAGAIVRRKSLRQTLISFVLARVATRSVPGAVIVGGGALAKALLDRRRNRRQAQREGDEKLLEQAHGE